MIRILIDECLSPELVALLYARGYEAAHVNILGFSGYRDRALIPFIQNEDWTFVTNNRRDFLALYRNLEIHAGLLIILDANTTAKQVSAMTAAVDAIEARGDDMVNQLVEVHADFSVTFGSWPFDQDNRP